MQEWFVAGAGLLLAIIGILLTIRYGKERRPLYAMRSIHIAAAQHKEMRILFRENLVDRLVLTRFVLWNAGRLEIRGEDIPNSNAGPALTLPPGSKLLDYWSDTTIGDKSAHMEMIKDNKLSISFDFLNHGDAVIGEVLMDYDISKSDAYITGHIKGGRLKRGETVNLTLFDNIFFILIFLTFIALSAGLFVHSLNQYIDGNSVSFIFSISSSLVVLSLAIINFRENVVNIPNKIPIQYNRFLSTGKINGPAS